MYFRPFLDLKTVIFEVKTDILTDFVWYSNVDFDVFHRFHFCPLLSEMSKINSKYQTTLKGPILQF